MKTTTIELIHRHGSVRKYKPDQVPGDMLRTIVASGQRASTSSNLQAYSVVAVRDEARRHRLAQLCGDQEQIRDAPVFLAWCADMSRLERECRRRELPFDSEYMESFLVAALDAGIAAQTAALAAESLGLGICYIGAIRNNPEEVIELLELPRYVFPITGMTLGWPVEQPGTRPRLPLEVVLHNEKYDSGNELPYLLEYDREMVATGIYGSRTVPKPGYPGEQEPFGWLASSTRRVSSPKRTFLRAVIENQGFGVK